LTRRCSRDTATLEGCIAYASTPRASSQRASQKPSRPASKASAIRVIVRPALTTSSRQRCSKARPFWPRLQLLARLTLNAGNHPANQPGRLAHLDDGNDRAIVVQGDEGPTQVVRLGHRHTPSVYDERRSWHVLSARPIASSGSGSAGPHSVVGSGELRALRDTRARQPDRRFTARAEWRSGCIRAAEGRLQPQQLRSKATLGGRQPKGLRAG
jgi:hypothetical protein